MLKLKHVCIPLTNKCNLRCKYCYNRLQKRTPPETLTDKMREFLSRLDAGYTEAVVMSGGEPLLRYDLIKEIRGIVPHGVPMRIMTNGTLLTDEIVEWVNEHRIEVQLGYDGEYTKFFRGVDVLEDERLLKLIRKIHKLAIAAVETKYNPNPRKNFEYTAEKLGRRGFAYRNQPAYSNSTDECDELMDGFDYDEYARGFREFRRYYYQEVTIFTLGRKLRGLNVCLNGDIVNKNSLDVLGTLDDDLDTILKRDSELELSKCPDTCPVRGYCLALESVASPSFCRAARIRGGLI